MEEDGLDDLGVNPELEPLRYERMSKEWIECPKGGGGLRTTKVDVSGAEDEVGVMKEPRNLALVSGVRGNGPGVVKKKGAQ